MDSRSRCPTASEAVNRTQTRNVLEQGVAEQVQSLLQNVVMVGTGTRAQVGDVPISGKTGTTEGYGDAWFVGWTPEYTIAVWVGYPNEFKSMETEFNGQPVAGGTFPAGIFKTFVESVLRIYPPKEDEEETDRRPTPARPPAPTGAPSPPRRPTDAAPEHRASRPGARGRAAPERRRGADAPCRGRRLAPGEEPEPAAARAAATSRRRRRRRGRPAALPSRSWPGPRHAPVPRHGRTATAARPPW